MKHENANGEKKMFSLETTKAYAKARSNNNHGATVYVAQDFDRFFIAASEFPPKGMVVAAYRNGRSVAR